MDLTLHDQTHVHVCLITKFNIKPFLIIYLGYVNTHESQIRSINISKRTHTISILYSHIFCSNASIEIEMKWTSHVCIVVVCVF